MCSVQTNGEEDEDDAADLMLVGGTLKACISDWQAVRRTASSASWPSRKMFDALVEDANVAALLVPPPEIHAATIVAEIVPFFWIMNSGNLSEEQAVAGDDESIGLSGGSGQQRQEASYSSNCVYS